LTQNVTLLTSAIEVSVQITGRRRNILMVWFSSVFHRTMLA